MRLLVALDGSPSSMEARDLVGGLAWPSATAITLMTATSVPVSMLTPGMAAGSWLEVAEDALQHQARDELAAQALPLKGRGWSIEPRVTVGRPPDAILEMAHEIDADLIVLGSRGHGRIRSMLLGSVSAEVAERAARSVLIARHDHVSRILVATDGSEGAAVIPEVLGQWGVLRGLPAVALSISPEDSPAFRLLVSLYTMGDRSIDAQREIAAQYRDAAADMARRLMAIEISGQAVSASGDPAHEIVLAADEHRADLVITGSRGLQGIDRWLLGSVARDVLVHTQASVLIVRGKGQ